MAMRLHFSTRLAQGLPVRLQDGNLMPSLPRAPLSTGHDWLIDRKKMTGSLSIRSLEQTTVVSCLLHTNWFSHIQMSVANHFGQKKKSTYGHVLTPIGCKGLLVLKKNAEIRLPRYQRRLLAILARQFVARMMTQCHFLVCQSNQNQKKILKQSVMFKYRNGYNITISRIKSTFLLSFFAFNHHMVGIGPQTAMKRILQAKEKTNSG